DVYIKPDITGFSVVSFGDADSIQKRGYDAAMKKKSKLDSIAQLQDTKTDRITVNPFTPKKSFMLESIALKGNEKYSRAYIRGKLRYKLGEELTYKKFAQGINNLAATNNFQRIGYSIHKT